MQLLILLDHVLASIYSYGRPRGAGRNPVCCLFFILCCQIQLDFSSVLVNLLELLVKVELQRMVLDLLHCIQVDRVIVGAKLFSLEEIYRSLIQL